MRETFRGFLRLRMLGSIPLLIIIVVLVGISAITRGSEVLGIAIIAAIPVMVVVALGWLMTRRAAGRRE